MGADKKDGQDTSSLSGVHVWATGEPWLDATLAERVRGAIPISEPTASHRLIVPVHYIDEEVLARCEALAKARARLLFVVMGPALPAHVRQLLLTGVDDVIRTPIDQVELDLRLHALVHRSGTFSIRSHTPRLEGRFLVRGSKRVELKPTQRKFVRELLSEFGAMVPHERLAKSLYGVSSVGSSIRHRLWQIVYKTRPLVAIVGCSIDGSYQEGYTLKDSE